MNDEFKILSVKKEIEPEKNYVHLVIEFLLTEQGKFFAKPLMDGYYKSSVIKDLKKYEENNQKMISEILNGCKNKRKIRRKGKKESENCFFSGYLSGMGFIRLDSKKQVYVFEEYLSFTNIVIGGIQDIENLMHGLNLTNCDPEYLFIKILKSLSEHWD